MNLLHVLGNRFTSTLWVENKEAIEYGKARQKHELGAKVIEYMIENEDKDLTLKIEERRNINSELGTVDNVMVVRFYEITQEEIK